MNIVTKNAMRLRSLVVFRNLLSDPVVAKFSDLLQVDPGDSIQAVDSYADFVSELFRHGDNWSRYLLDLVLEDENVYIHQCCAGKILPSVSDCLVKELAILEEMSYFDGESIRKMIRFDDYLPRWKTSRIDFAEAFRRRIDEVHTRGYGIYAQHRFFTVENGRIVPVLHPDPQTLAQLPGYEAERAKVIANTEALLTNKPANNVLLYGDAGTGKSSTVKAIVNELWPRGLRLVEVKKNQLYEIPGVIEELAANPLKFILFIDDLSFSGNDEDFAALKAILEGSVGTRGGNVAVYATSNRRHLVKEDWAARSGSDLHESDTRQELMSLAARFGLTVTFATPDKACYLKIVHELARQYGLEAEPGSLDVRAEAHAIRNGGRSPRVAKQFVQLVKAGVI